MNGLLKFLVALLAGGGIIGASYTPQLRGWWADKMQVRRARREWRRRVLALKSARAALDGEGLRPTTWAARLVAILLGAAVGIIAGLALAGCGGRYPLDADNPAGSDAASHAPAVDTGSADAGAPSEMIGLPQDGAPADTSAPQCRDLQLREEFFSAETADAAPQLLSNDLCSRVCRNSAGGQTCIALTGELVHCAACDSQVHP